MLAILLGACLALSSAAPDAAASCLDAATEVEVADAWVDAYAFEAPGQAVDARGMHWIGIPDHAVEQRGNTVGCWVGGYVEGPYDDDSVYECEPIHCPNGVCPAPCLAFHQTAGLDVETAALITLEDVRVSHYGDGIERGKEAGRRPMTVIGAYLHDIKDDAVENDWGASIRVHDSLLERVNTAFASRPRSGVILDARNRTFEVRDTLVLLHSFANSRHMDPGHGKFWKWPNDGMGPAFRVTDNTFVVTDHPGGLVLPLADQVLECANNTLLWADESASHSAWLASPEVESDGLTAAERLLALADCFIVVVKPDEQSQADFLAQHFDPLVAAWKQSHAAALPPDPRPACSDGRDNDDDRFADAEDWGCADSLDLTEKGMIGCDDDADNDGDGRVDMDDPDCVNGRDRTEATSSHKRCGLGFELVAGLLVLAPLARLRRRR